MAISKVQLPLKNVAKQIRNVASALAPRKTGNLRNVLRSYNTPDRMVKFGKNGSADITFYYAPPGATYGKYWNKPSGTGKGTTATIKKRYPQNFDYASKAMKDTTVKKMIKDYASALGKQIALDLREAVRKP
jgi:hypothetical protein